MQKSNLQSKEEKSIIIEIPYKSKISFFVSCKYPEKHSKLTCAKYFPRGCFCVIAVIIVLLFTRSFLLFLSKYVQKEQFFLMPCLEKSF